MHTYQTTSPSLSPQQIITALLITVQQLALIICHPQELSLLCLALILWHCLFIPALAYETYVVVNTDTRDPMLRGATEQDFPSDEIVFCVLCGHLVLRRSYHCWRCKRCTDNIDHHCRYLNCCIAQTNYEAFLRLVIVFAFYSANATVLLFLYCQHNPFSLVVGVISAVQLALAIALFLFHLWINLCAKTSTVTFIKGQSKPQEPSHEGYCANQLQEVQSQLGNQTDDN